MMNRNRLLHKYLLLALILTALFAMTGCRTRITNNSEVSNVYYDEDGFLTETYQMRRDELGLSTAESPIFPDLGSGDTEEDFDSSEDTGLNYEPEEDTYVDPPTTSTTTTSSSSGRRYSSPGRRYSSPSGSGSGSRSSDTVEYEVTLDPGEGTIEGRSAGARLKQNIKKNKEFTLPQGDIVTRKGYKLNKWNDGSKDYDPGAKVKITKKVTFTAKWTKNEPAPKPTTPEKKEYTISFDAAGGEGTYPTIKIDEGGNYKLPKNNPTRYGYEFEGWYTEAEGGKKISEGDSVKGTQTLYAHWNAYKYWNKEADNAIKGKEANCFLYKGKSAQQNLITSCNGNLVGAGENPDFVIAFADSGKEQEMADALRGDNPELADKDVYIISTNATTSDDNEKLLYKIDLINLLYENIEVDEAGEYLDVESIERISKY